MEKSMLMPCNSSLKKDAKKCMGVQDMNEDQKKAMKAKLKKSLEAKFAGKQLTASVMQDIRETAKEELAKALSAGYGSATAAPETIKEVDPSAPLQPKVETAPAEISTEIAPDGMSVTAAAPAPEAKPAFNGNLFRQFTLGATLRQDPSGAGNIMTGVKSSQMDYVAKQKAIIRNVKMSSEELAKLTPKKK